MNDPWEDPEMKEWVQRAQEELVPKMKQSGLMMSLYTGGYDIKFAVETGLAILMDKPMILAVQSGTQAPDKLVQVADYIIEADPTTEEGRSRLADKVEEIMKEIADE